MGDQYSDGPYISSYEPHDLINIKTVIDNGRPVTGVIALSANGEQTGGDFSSGEATVPLSNRDNYPLIEEGDIIHAFCWNTLATEGWQTVAIFIVEDVDVDLVSETVTYSGGGVGKEFQRKILELPFIATEYAGTSGSFTQTYIFLDAAHAAADDFYNGAIIAIAGSMCDVSDYVSGGNRAYVENWRPDDIGSGSGEAYIMYFGNATNDIQKATANSQTWWTPNVNGTTNGSFINVNGRTCLDVMKDIAEDTGWQFTFAIGPQPEREVIWFDPNAAPVDSGVTFKKFSDTDHTELVTDEDIGPVISCTRRSSKRESVTRLTVATKDAVTLVGLTLSDITLPTGFDVNFDTSTVTHTAAEAGLSVPEIVHRTHVFNNIVAANGSGWATKKAQITLFNSTITKLRERIPDNWTYILRTKLNRDLQVGQTAHLTYTQIVPGTSEHVFTVDDDLWIRSIACSATADDGARFMDIELGDYFRAASKDPYKTIANAVKGKSSQNAGQIVITGVGDTGVTDHGFLLGLPDDDHPQYLLRDGGNSVTGDILVLAGKTIDGVDLSEHAIDIDAHHDLVTVGNGLDVATQHVTLVLDPDSGLVTSGTGLALGTPTNVSAVTTNDVSGTGHTHEVVAYSNGISQPGALLESSANGYISLEGMGIGRAANEDKLQLDVPIEFDTANHISTIAGALTIAPNAGLIVTGNTAAGSATNVALAALHIIPSAADDYALWLKQHPTQSADILRIEDTAGSAIIILTNDGDLESGNPGFVSGSVGWQINRHGDVEFNNATIRGELHASIFVADEMHATNGTMVVMTAGQVYEDESFTSTLPSATGLTFTLYVKASLDTGLCYFSADDIIRMKFMQRGSGGNLKVWDVGVEVETIGTVLGRDISNGEAGFFAMTCTWRVGGQASLIIPSNTAAIRWGRVGEAAGNYVGGIKLTSDQNYSPYIDIFTLPADHTWGVMPVESTYVRMGNIDGVLGSVTATDEMGIAIGNLADTAADAKYLVASSEQFRLNNINLEIWGSDGLQKIDMKASGAVQFGTDTSAVATRGFTFWASSGNVIIGNSSEAHLKWDNSAGQVELRSGSNIAITLKTSGDSEFTGQMDIVSGGSIVATSTTFDDSGIFLDDVGITFPGHDDLAGRSGSIKYGNTATDPYAFSYLLDVDGSVNYILEAYNHNGDGASDVATIEVITRDYNGTKQASFGLLSKDADTGDNSFAVISIRDNVRFLVNDSMAAVTGYLAVDDGVFIGDDAPATAPTVGMLVQDMGTRDGIILELRSTGDLTGLTTQGMNTASTFFQISKLAGSTGGVNIRAASETNRAIYITGSVNTVDAAQAPFIFSARKDNAALADADNMMLWKNYGTDKIVFKGDGDIYTKGTYETYHKHNDDDLVKAMDLYMSGGDLLQANFNGFVEANYEKLQSVGLVDARGFRSIGRFQMLHNGTLVKHGDKLNNHDERLAALEAHING